MIHIVRCMANKVSLDRVRFTGCLSNLNLSRVCSQILHVPSWPVLLSADRSLCFSGLSVDSWLENAADLLAFATREVDIARVLQSSLEAMLKQAECDTRTQVEKTNRALDTRVQQTRTAKQTLEDKLSMVRAVEAAADQLSQMPLRAAGNLLRWGGV